MAYPWGRRFRGGKPMGFRCDCFQERLIPSALLDGSLCSRFPVSWGRESTGEEA